MSDDKNDRPITPPPDFDRLMRGLIAVPKDELEAEIRKDEKKKAKAPKPKPKK